MKTIFITLGEDIIARNILFTDFWLSLNKQHEGVHFVFLVQPDRKEYYKDLFKDESNVSVETYKRSSASRFESALMSLARSGINTHTNTWSKMRSWKRGDSSLVITLIKFFHQVTLGNFNWYKHLLRRLILRTGENDTRARELFNTYSPDMVCALSLTNYDFDVLIAREAKKRGVRIFGMVRSWDNLSSHGLMRVVPDVFVLQNEFLVDMAYKHQAIKEGEIPIYISGLPHYDLFHRDDFFIDRETYFKENGFDPSKKLLLYAGMGEFLFKREGDIINILEEIIKKGEIHEPVQVMYSAHPKFLSSLERIKKMKHILPAPEVGYIDLNKPSWQSGLKHTKDLINLIYHADVLIMGGSTLAIDAAVLDRPVICVGFDGYAQNMSYWESVERFYDLYTHFEALLGAGGITISRSKDELIRDINKYLLHPEFKEAGRKKMVKMMAPQFGGTAGKHLVALLQKEIDRIK